MSELGRLTELLHLAHTRPEKLRLEYRWYRHLGRLKVIGERWQEDGYGGLMHLESADIDAVDETVKPQEEMEYGTLSWWRGLVFRATVYDAQRNLKYDNLTTPDYGGSFTPQNRTLWEYTPTPQRPNVLDAKAFDEPLLEPAFLLSAFTLEATERTEIAAREALTLRAKPRSERGFSRPLGFDLWLLPTT